MSPAAEAAQCRSRAIRISWFSMVYLPLARTERYLITRGVRIWALIVCTKISLLSEPADQARLVYFLTNHLPPAEVILARKEKPCSSSIMTTSCEQACAVWMSDAPTVDRLWLTIRSS